MVCIRQAPKRKQSLPFGPSGDWTETQRDLDYNHLQRTLPDLKPERRIQLQPDGV